MKKSLSAVIISFVLIACIGASVLAAHLSPALDVLSDSHSMTVSALRGEKVSFTEKDFLDASGLEKIESIRIVSLPDEADGILCYNDSAVAENQVIKASEIENLHFDANNDISSASFKFTFDGLYNVSCNLKFTDKVNHAPSVYDNASVSAMSGTVCAGVMRANDPDGDSVTFEITKYPTGGYIDYDCKTGDFSYRASTRVAADSFEYRVCDEYGAYSECSVVTLNVTDNTTKYVFSDMSGNSAETAAAVLCGKGIISANVKNGKSVFSPKSEVSRIEFLKWAMEVFGASNIPTVEKTVFADDSEIKSSDNGYVYSAYKLGIINGRTSENGAIFCPDSPITKAEASVILNNIIGYTAKNKLFCSEEIPNYAVDAISAMYEIGVYEPVGGRISASSNLTKAEAARMLYTISCMLYE